MTHSLRRLQILADAAVPPPPRSAAQQRQHAYLLAAATTVLAESVTNKISFRQLSQILRVRSETLRRHFIDLDALLGEILLAHLANLTAILAAIPPTAPNAEKLCRRAYLAATRTESGAFIPAHRLLLRDSWMLPEDLLARINPARVALAERMVGAHVAKAMPLIDSEDWIPSEMEDAIDRLAKCARLLAVPQPKPDDDHWQPEHMAILPPVHPPPMHATA